MGYCKKDDAWDIYEDNARNGGSTKWKRKEYETTDADIVFDAELVEDDLDTATRVLAALSYCSWLLLITWILKKEDPFVKFHLNQGVVLLIIRAFAGFFGFVGIVVRATVLLFCCWGFIMALTGREKVLPIVGNIKIVR